jgi:hypothetical protein
MDSITRFSTLGFFLSVKPLTNGLEPFQICLRICRDIGLSMNFRGIIDTVKIIYAASMTPQKQSPRF